MKKTVLKNLIALLAWMMMLNSFAISSHGGGKQSNSKIKSTPANGRIGRKKENTDHGH